MLRRAHQGKDEHMCQQQSCCCDGETGRAVEQDSSGVALESLRGGKGGDASQLILGI